LSCFSLSECGSHDFALISELLADGGKTIREIIQQALTDETTLEISPIGG
jgi:hypothetical protein